MSESFQHRALRLQDTGKPLVYTAMSKHLFYMREHISKHVLDNGGVPLNPFMIFGYFMLDTVERDVVRQANNVLVARADELWMYGPVSDGALAEILQAKEQKKKIKYLGIVASKDILELSIQAVELEDDIKDQRHLL